MSYRAAGQKLFTPAGWPTVREVTYAPADDAISIELTEPMPGTTLLRVDGEVDMLSSPNLRQAISGQISGARPRRLLIDLDGVEFLGTSGLAALVEARAEALGGGVELWLVCSSRQVLRPLEIAGLIELFQVTHSKSEAMASAQPDPNEEEAPKKD